MVPGTDAPAGVLPAVGSDVGPTAGTGGASISGEHPPVAAAGRAGIRCRTGDGRRYPDRRLSGHPGGLFVRCIGERNGLQAHPGDLFCAGLGRNSVRAVAGGSIVAGRVVPLEPLALSPDVRGLAAGAGELCFRLALRPSSKPAGAGADQRPNRRAPDLWHCVSCDPVAPRDGGPGSSLLRPVP